MQPASLPAAYDDYSAEARERIARLMAKSSTRSGTESAESEPSKLKAFTPTPLYTQKSDSNDQERRDLQSPKQSNVIKAVAKRLGAQMPAAEETRTSTRNSRSTDAIWLQAASGLSSPARSMSAVDAPSSTDRSPPREPEQPRPRAQSVPAANIKAAASSRLYEEVPPDSHSFAERHGLGTASDFDTARGLGRPGSFDLEMERAYSDPRSRRLLRPSSSSKKLEAEPAPSISEPDPRRRINRPPSFERHSFLAGRNRSDEEPSRSRTSTQHSFNKNDDDAKARTSFKAGTSTEDSLSDVESARHAKADAETGPRARPIRPAALEAPSSPHGLSIGTVTPGAEGKWQDSSPHKPPRRPFKPPSFRVHIPSDSSDVSDTESLHHRSPHLNVGRTGTASGSDSDTSLPAMSPRRRMNSMSHLSRRTSEGSEFDSDVEAGHAGRAGASDLATDMLLELKAALKPRHAQTSPLTGGQKGPGTPTALQSSESAVTALTTELEAALYNAVKIKDEVVGITAPQGPLAAIAQGGETAVPAAKKRVQIVLPEKLASFRDATQQNGLPARPSLMVGSGMLKAGEWDNEGWRELSAEGVMPIPAILQQIDHTHIEKVRELGRGQFGSVWLARWLGVEVAVKELRDSSDARGNAEMLREAELLASLCHPCIITLYGVAVGQESACPVLEYVRGSSLRTGLQQLKAQGTASPWLRCAIALQAARGLEYLHQRHIVHFDIKAENLLGDLRDPQNPVVKIADMGLSKRKAATTVSGNMRGTLPWMAPELFPSTHAEQGEEGVDRVTEKVDVFSFGICLWEIWTLGDAMYQGLNISAVFSGVAAGTLRPRPVPDAPPAWTALMQDCWGGSPSARPSLSQVATRLAAMLPALRQK